MIESVDLRSFELKSNFLLVKMDSNYDVIPIDGPSGKTIELKIVTFGEHEANHYSISGTVIKKPATTYFFDKKTECNRLDFQSRIKASLQIDGEFPFDEGAKVYFNYNVQLGCEDENRLVETAEHGICILISLDAVFGYQKDGDIMPVNGYVFFKRDKQEDEIQYASGLIGIRNAKYYGTNFATVISAAPPVKNYMDEGGESGEEFIAGDRVIIDHRFGYKMAYDLHGGEIKNVEVAFRKYIIAKIMEDAA